MFSKFKSLIVCEEFDDLGSDLPGSEEDDDGEECSQVVIVPRELTPEMREAFHSSYEAYEDGRGECPDSQWRAMLRAAPKPVQHQGEPVALPERKGRHLRYDTLMPAFWKGWNACLDDIAKLGPLYTRPAPVVKQEPYAWHVESPADLEFVEGIAHTKEQADKYVAMGWSSTPVFRHADPGEVERLRAEIERMRERVTPAHKSLIGKHAEIIKERDTLRAQLAEAHALLRDIAKAQDEEGWWVNSENGPDYWECPACYATSIAVRKNGQIVGGGKGEIKHERDCWIQRCAELSASAEPEVKS